MLIQIDFANKSMLFKEPIKIFTIRDLDDIENSLIEIMAWVKKGYYAAGYLAYESSEALNSFNKTKDPYLNKMPLLYFGIFDNFSLPDQITPIHEKLSLHSNTNHKEYASNLDKIKQQIKAGNTYQTNYTVQFNGKFTGNPFNYYYFLQQNNQANYCAYLQFENKHILSISPELFFQLDDNIITTKPMKGTAARGYDLVTDMLQRAELRTEKNQAENMMIVDLLRNDLSKISKPGSVKVTKLFEIEKYPTVWQLTSTIQSTLKENITLLQILQALFPSGSITGAPKSSTMQLIAELETMPREIYCGTIGYIEPFFKKVTFNIPIRTLVINNDHASYGVGGGITWDSIEQHEYAEIIAKTAILNSNGKLPAYLIETFLLEQGKYFLLAEHLTRLVNSAAYFDIKFIKSEIENALIQQAKLYPTNNYKVRLILYMHGNFSIEIKQITQPMQFLEVRLAEHHVNSKNIYLYHKTSNREHFPKICENTESILFNENHEITEFVNGNIVLYIENKWVTPVISSGLLPGTMRQFYLTNNILNERVISIKDILQAEKIAFINSVRKWIDIPAKVFDKLKQQIMDIEE